MINHLGGNSSSREDKIGQSKFSVIPAYLELGFKEEKERGFSVFPVRLVS